MNKKAMKSVLRKKFNAWTASIKDAKVKALVEKNSLITGGCITSMLLKEDVKDYDVYFTNKKTALAVANYYVSEFLATHPKMDITVVDEQPDLYMEGRIKIVVASKGVAGEVDTDTHPVFEDAVEVLGEESQGKFRPVYLSSNAVTLSDKMQLVLRFYGDAKEIHTNYDFVHCTNHWTSEYGEVVLRQEALESILNKELIYTGSKYPICSIIRTRKFVNRGWFCNAGQYLKMCFQVSELDLKNLDVLEDQLVGVDSAYFQILIDALRTQGEGQKINSLYVSEIVDRIFN